MLDRTNRLICLWIVSLILASACTTPATNRQLEQAAARGGVLVEDRRATLKSGYIFERLDENRVRVEPENVAMRKGKGVVIKCNCDDQGSCKLVIKRNWVVCTGDNCCDLEVEVPTELKMQPRMHY